MNRISYIEHKYNKKLGQIVEDMRNEGKTMNQIADELGLAVTTLYNHLRKDTTSTPEGVGLRVADPTETP